MDAHNRAIALTSTHIAHSCSTSTPFLTYYGSTNSTPPARQPATAIINTSSLNHVLSITPSSDSLTEIATVEPSVSVAALVHGKPRKED